MSSWLFLSAEMKRQIKYQNKSHRQIEAGTNEENSLDAARSSFAINNRGVAACQ